MYLYDNYSIKTIKYIESKKKYIKLYICFFHIKMSLLYFRPDTTN